MATKISYGVANIASQAEAEAGTAVDKFMTPERAAQATTARIATQAQAEAGTNTTQLMTPERASQALIAQAPASAQIMTFSADSQLTITPNVVDGMYRITGVLDSSTDNIVYIQTSDDGGSNYLDTSGDTFSVVWYERDGGAFTSAEYSTEPGFRLKLAGGGNTAGEIGAFQALLWTNGTDRVACAIYGPSFDASGLMYTYHLNGANTTGGSHATGIDRIRITTSTGTVTGTVVVENLRLS